MEHKFIKDMTLNELNAAERRTLWEIRNLPNKPISIQYETGNAFEARLKAIQRRVSEMLYSELERVK